MITSWRITYDDEHNQYTTYDYKCKKEGWQVEKRHMMINIIDTLHDDKLKNNIWWWT